MNVYLDEQDINQMPEPGRTWFLNWLPGLLRSRSSQSDSKFGFLQVKQPTETANQLTLNLETQKQWKSIGVSQVTIVHLFDAGILKAGMPVRVRLKRNLEKSLGHSYVDGLQISSTGTVLFQGKAFNKPSPLATEVNRSPSGGWEYVEVKKNGQWMRLDELREIWRNTRG